MSRLKKKIKFLITLIFLVAITVTLVCSLSGCSEAERKSTEISKQADNFETARRLTVINTRNDKIILEFTGTFSVQGSSINTVDILCAVGDNRYEKHFFSLNDWTIYVVEDVSNQGVDKYFREIKYYPENK